MKFSSPVSDSLLGALHYQEDQDGYLGQVRIGDTEVELFLFVNADYPKLDERIASARRLLEQLAARDLRREVAAHLVKRVRQWREEEGLPGQLSVEEIAARLRLASLHIPGEGESGVSFDDGELFGGHSVDAELTPKNLKLINVELSG